MTYQGPVFLRNPYPLSVHLLVNFMKGIFIKFKSIIIIIIISFYIWQSATNFFFFLCCNIINRNYVVVTGDYFFFFLQHKFPFLHMWTTISGKKTSKWNFTYMIFFLILTIFRICITPRSYHSLFLQGIGTLKLNVSTLFLLKKIYRFSKIFIFGRI